jgi:serine/threonine-protein kinase
MVVPGQACAVVPGSVLQHRYRMDGRIALGGTGEVWRGTDLALKRVVAVKLLRPEYAQDEDSRARFRIEGRHAALLCHPNIAQVYDYCDMAPPVSGFLVMELVDGQPLARLLDEGPMEPADAMDIIAEAAEGLQAAHAAGVLHRDIKPGNLLVSRDGHVKITDFGLAQVAGSARLTRTGMLVGTPAYLAPERATGGVATPAADLYALGVVAYECLTGQVPFDGDPLAVALAHTRRAMPPLPRSVPAQVAALVADLTAKDPSARPPSAGDVSVRAQQLRTASSWPPDGAPGLRMLAAGMLAGLLDAALRVRRVLSWRPPGRGNEGGARPRWRQRLSGAGLTVRVALVLAGMVVAGLGWALAAHHGPAPAGGRAPGAHSPAPHAGSGGAAGPRPVASPSLRSTGVDPRASQAPTRAHRPSQSSHAPSASPPTPAPSSPTPAPSSPTPAPSSPTPAPSSPTPAPSLPLPD